MAALPKLNSEQKRALIADELRDNPGRPDREIARALGVDDKTVASVRAELEAVAEIPQHRLDFGFRFVDILSFRYGKSDPIHRK